MPYPAGYLVTGLRNRQLFIGKIGKMSLAFGENVQYIPFNTGQWDRQNNGEQRSSIPSWFLAPSYIHYI